MRRSQKFIIGFAALGLAMAATSYAYAASVHYTDPMNRLDMTLTVLSVVLCPTQLIFAFCLDCEAVGYGGLIMYSIIGVSNAVLYALIGFVLATLRRSKPDNSLRLGD